MIYELEHKVHEVFADDAPTGFGSGWWSGVLSMFFGLLAFGGVLCLHFPQFLTSPELRPYYNIDLIRLLIQLLIGGSMVFGVLSALLRKRKVLAFTGMVFGLIATVLGGSTVVINETLTNGPAVGLDWFLLDILFTTLIFSPIELIWPAYPSQGIFRPEWITDVGYFLTTHLPIQISSFLILLPATAFAKYLGSAAVIDGMSALPLVVQFFLAVLVADLSEYVIHRASHTVPFLWRIHSIHHSSKSLDWIAGSRAHFVDDLLIRGLILVPMMFFFPRSIIIAYLVFVTFHATWEHCNFGPTVKWLEPYIVLPRFHHWHHTSQAEAIDKNFAVHFPWIDKIFGTYYLPEDKWPDTYGLNNEKIPEGIVGQTIYPFYPAIVKQDGKK